jgi:hypothetical protein
MMLRGMHLLWLNILFHTEPDFVLAKVNWKKIVSFEQNI